MNNPRFTGRQSVVKLIFLFLPLILIFTSCKKDPAKDKIVTPTTKEFAFKTEDWNVWPYSGSPGEDSMYSSWTPQLSANNLSVIMSQNIKKVSIKTKSGGLQSAPVFVIVTQNDTGYRYQLGEPLGKPMNLLLWWIQKQPGEKPDADSVFISLQY
jgi:hypothetical protein